MLIHLVINDGSSVPLCSCDKQLILWTVREIITTAAEINVDLIDSSLRWLVWLLNCPVKGASAYAPPTRSVDSSPGSGADAVHARGTSAGGGV